MATSIAGQSPLNGSTSSAAVTSTNVITGGVAGEDWTYRNSNLATHCNKHGWTFGYGYCLQCGFIPNLPQMYYCTKHNQFYYRICASCHNPQFNTNKEQSSMLDTKALDLDAALRTARDNAKQYADRLIDEAVQLELLASERRALAAHMIHEINEGARARADNDPIAQIVPTPRKTG